MKRVNLNLPIVACNPSQTVIKRVKIETNPHHFNSNQLESDAAGWADFFYYNSPSRFVTALTERLSKLGG